MCSLSGRWLTHTHTHTQVELKLDSIIASEISAGQTGHAWLVKSNVFPNESFLNKLLFLNEEAAEHLNKLDSEQLVRAREDDLFFLLTDQLVFFDEAAELSTRNQFAPLPQDQLRRHELLEDGIIQCDSSARVLKHTITRPFGISTLLLQIDATF